MPFFAFTSDLHGKMRREDYPMYPPRGMREALANAICHRDYTNHSGAVGLAMYNDHLEIINPGSFHFGMTPEKLIKPHQSKPWNPLIAEGILSSRNHREMGDEDFEYYGMV